MKRNLPYLAGALAVAFAAAAPALAHHSFAAEYDKEKPLKFTGTVTKFDRLHM